MGKRGPKPTPTPLLKLRGSFKAERRKGEPRAQTEIPPCPAWVSPQAAAFWPEIAEMLYGLGVMAKVHGVALALLVDALADWIKWTRAADGEESKLHHHNLKGKAWDRVLRACREFGMTPSAISAVRTVQAEEKPQGPRGVKLA